MELFELNGRVVVNLTDAVKAFNEIQNQGQQTQSKMSKFFSAVGKGAAVAGKAMAAGLAAGATAMAGLTGKALQLSGELEQNMGGSEAVFGDFADSIQAKAKEAFSKAGLSTSDYLATANKMGSLFKGAGFDVETAMGMTTDAMERAADVASIMGIDTESAMEAIAGAAKGNFTMMDNLGVAMNDTTLQAYALSKGIDKSTSEMTNQEKIGLAMQMFMEKTADYAGNYAKENDTLAGSLNTAKASMTNFLDGSGSVEDMVASLGNLANVAARSLTEILPRLTTGLKDAIAQIMPLIPPLLDQLLPAIVEGATSLINGVVAVLPDVLTTIMDALPALIQGVEQIFNALIEALPGIIQALVSALPTLIPMLVDALVSMIVTLCTMIPQIIQPIIDYLPDIIVALVDALMQNLPALIEGLVQLVVALVAAMPQIILELLNALPDVIISVVNGLLGAMPILIEGVGQIVTSVVAAIWEFLSGFPGAIANYTTKMWNNLGNIISGVWNAIKTAISTYINTIKTNTSTAWNGIKNTISNVVNGIKTTVSNVFNSVKNTVGNIFDSIKEKMAKPIEKARDLIKGIVDKIKGFFSGMKISFPNIKLPHFTVKPSGWQIGDLLKGKIPSLGIDWYARAMNEPLVMTNPTIFGYNPATGRLQGGGEAGSEVVSGTNTLLNMISNVVAAQNSALAGYLQQLVAMLAEYMPQILEAAGHDIVTDDGALLARYVPMFNVELGKLSNRKDRGR